MQPPSKAEKRRIRGRLGYTLYQRRRYMEDARELKLGGRVRLCPMQLIKPVLTALLKLSGLWKRGYREFLSPVIRHNTFQIPGLPPCLESLTILHLSDLHLDIDPKLAPLLAEKIRGLQYDFAVITGDFNNYTVHHDDAALDAFESILMPAFSSPVYGVLGNHDTLQDAAKLERIGVQMLVNESVLIPYHNATLQLAGVDDPNIFKTHHLERALRHSKTTTLPDLRILLAHAPTLFQEAADHQIQVVLCGHTHGGQICLPNGYSPRIHREPIPTHLKKGLWHHQSTQGWTSTGTGACGIPIRLNCPPEILLHHFAPKA